MIIPPGSLVVINRRSTMRRRLHLRSVITPNWYKWNPIIVVGKSKPTVNYLYKICIYLYKQSDTEQIFSLWYFSL